MSITQNGHHAYCYGHAVLDFFLPLFNTLKQRNLLSNLNELHWRHIGAKLDLYQIDFLREYIDVLCGERCKFSFVHDEKAQCLNLFSHDLPCYKVLENLRKMLAVSGNVLNCSISSQIRSPNLQAFVTYIVKALDLAEIKREKLVTIVDRKNIGHPNRRILNILEVSEFYKSKGYAVEIVDFVGLSLKEQVLQMRRTEMLVSSYGSNLVNGIFLQEGSSVVVCWPNPESKQLLARQQCIIHCALLVLGLTIVEIDKPYDQADNYRTEIENKNMFTKHGNVITLIPNAKWTSWTDITIVDFSVPIDLLHQAMVDARKYAV